MINVHFCPLDRQCREYGAPWRLHVGAGRWFYTIALLPSAKVQKRGTDWRDGEWVWFRRDPRVGH